VVTKFLGIIHYLWLVININWEICIKIETILNIERVVNHVDTPGCNFEIFVEERLLKLFYQLSKMTN
jgi:hypothetical protein